MRMVRASYIPIPTATDIATNIATNIATEQTLSSRAEWNHSLANGSRSRGTLCWPVIAAGPYGRGENLPSDV